MKTCAYCNEPILAGQPTVADDCGEPGDQLHLDCAVAIQDGIDIDAEHGDN